MRSITDVVSIETDTPADGNKVSYRIAVDLPSGPGLIEQVAYYSEENGQTTHLRLVCTGFRSA